jgi:hypothetical protein
MKEKDLLERVLVVRRWCETHNVKNPNKNVFSLKGFGELIFRLVLMFATFFAIVYGACVILTAVK